MEHHQDEKLKGALISTNSDLQMLNEEIHVLYNQKIQDKQFKQIRKYEIYEQYKQAKMQLKQENQRKTLKSQYQNLDRFLNIGTNSSSSRNNINDDQKIESERSLNSPEQIFDSQLERQIQKNLEFQEMKQILDNIKVPTQRTKRKLRRELLTDYISGQIFKQNKKIVSREQNLINILGSEELYKQFKFQNQNGVSKSQKSKTHSASRSKNKIKKSQSIYSSVSSDTPQQESLTSSDSMCNHEITKDFNIQSIQGNFEEMQKEYLNNQKSKNKDSILQSYNSSRKDYQLNERTQQQQVVEQKEPAQLSASNALSQQISQNLIMQLRESVVEILKKPSNKRTEEELQQMVEYFTQFDFIQKEKQKIELNNKMEKEMIFRGQNNNKNKQIHTEVVTEMQSQELKQDSAEADQLNEIEQKSVDISENKSVIKTDQIFSCDIKNIEKQCYQMKYLVLQNDESIYDYGSQGESFYMLLSGQVTCKVPSLQYLIFLSQEEKEVFQLQYKDDIVKIQDAQIENQILQSKYLVSEQMLAQGLSEDFNQKYELKLKKINNKLDKITQKHPLFKNPYFNMKIEEFQQCVDKLLEKEINRLQLKYKRENKKVKEKSKFENESNYQNILSAVNKSIDSNVFSSNNSHNSKSIQNQSKEKVLKHENLQSSNLSLNEANYIYQNKDYLDLEQACQNLLTNFKNQSKRQYYKLTVFKSIKVLKEFESFGELSLVSDQVRTEKMVVSGNAQAQFAVLSKKDYKLAIGKIQNMVNQNRVNFLKQYFVFKNLSDSALSSLSQAMKEKTYCKGQYVYQEDIDIADKIYLVQKGHFKSIKRIPIQQNEKKEIDLQMILRQKKETDDDSQNEEEGIIDMDKYKKQDAVNRYQNIPQKKFRQIEVCIHSQFDIFGYEQFFSEESKPKICHSVMCLQNDSVVISINKKYLNNHIRRNTAPYIQLVDAWKDLVSSRSKQTLNASIDKNQEQMDHDASNKDVKKKKTREQIMKEVQEIKMFDMLTVNLNHSQESIQIKDETIINYDSEEKLEDEQKTVNEQVKQDQEKFIVDKKIDIDFKLQKGKKNREKELVQTIKKVFQKNSHIIESSNVKKKIDEEKIYEQEHKIDMSKQKLMVDFTNFRKSILGSVSQQELKNVKEIESQIQKKLFLSRNKNIAKTDLNQIKYPIKGTINSSQLILQSYTIPKQIKMRQQLINAQKQVQNLQIKKYNLNHDKSITEMESTEKSVSKMLRNEGRNEQMPHYLSRQNKKQVSAFNSFNHQSTTLLNHHNVIQSENLDLTESLNNSKIQNQILIESMINSDQLLITQNNHLANQYKDYAQDFKRFDSQKQRISNQNVKQINIQQIQNDVMLNSLSDQSIQRHDEYQNQFIQNSVNNTIRSKDSNKQNKTSEQQDDWNKESNIVQSQCQRFMLKTRNNIHRAHSFLDADISCLQNQKSTLNSRNQASNENLHPYNFSDEYYMNNEIQRKIQRSVISQKNYDFDKDIENIIRLKKQKLKGKGEECTTLFSSNKNSNSDSEEKKEKRNLQSLRDKQQSQIYKLKLDLLKNPIISMKQIKKKEIQRTQIVSNENRKRRVINIYNSSNSRKIFVPSCLSNSNLQQTIQNNENQIQNGTIITESNHIDKNENTETLLKLKLQRSGTLKQNLNNMGIQRIDKNQSNLLQNKNIKHLQQDKKIFKKLKDQNQSYFNSKFSFPKIIMRQILFENNELNQKVLSEQDFLRQIYREQNNSQIEAKKDSYEVNIKSSIIQKQHDAYHNSISSLPPNNFFDNNFRNVHVNHDQAENRDQFFSQNSQGRNLNSKTQTIYQTQDQKSIKLDSKFGEKQYILQEDQHDQNINFNQY